MDVPGFSLPQQIGGQVDIAMFRKTRVLATVLLASAFAALAGGLVGWTSASPEVQVREVPTTLPASTVTARMTVAVTTSVTATETVSVPSPVYVTVQPSASAMSRLETLAYCRDLAARLFPDGPPSTDPLMNQIVNGYASAQRQRTENQCMAEHGYPVS
jgi:hypothetical protein